ncbi:MAG: hypothetical protein M3Z14_03620 [Candidatus Eremiobacteraeota bacterium]|nr:hypothetical protein [Candidatus Eremiobacteraeota bacterium]
MSDLQYLRSVIPNFAGYKNEKTRRLSDEQVRAVAGSALAVLSPARVANNTNGLQEQWEGLLLKCGFANQLAFKHIQHAQLSDEQTQRLEAADAQLLHVVQRVNETGGEGLRAYLGDFEAALKARDDAMMGVESPV